MTDVDNIFKKFYKALSKNKISKAKNFLQYIPLDYRGIIGSGHYGKINGKFSVIGVIILKENIELLTHALEKGYHKYNFCNLPNSTAPDIIFILENFVFSNFMGDRMNEDVSIPMTRIIEELTRAGYDWSRMYNITNNDYEEETNALFNVLTYAIDHKKLSLDMMTYANTIFKILLMNNPSLATCNRTKTFNDGDIISHSLGYLLTIEHQELGLSDFYAYIKNL